jgi:hypothetical protein
MLSMRSCCSTSALPAGATFADVAVEITKIQMTVQYTTLGICNERLPSGTSPAKVVVKQIASAAGLDLQLKIKMATGFDTSAAQCAADAQGQVTADFSISNTGQNALTLFAVLDDSIASTFGGEDAS